MSEYKLPTIDVLRKQALTLLKNNQANEAIRAYQQILAIHPDDLESMLNICIALQALNRPENAADGYREILKKSPNNPEAQNNLCTLLVKLEHYDEALELCEQVCKQHPDNPVPATTKAKILSQMGNWQQAKITLDSLLQNHPISFHIVSAHYQIARQADEFEKSIAMHEQLLEEQGSRLNQAQKYETYFHLGKLYDATNKYDKAFANITAGNNIFPANFDVSQYNNMIDDIITTLDNNTYTNISQATNNSKQPIFIVGMLRTGTSLIEQILDSHSQIRGGGELPLINQISIQTERLIPGSEYPNNLLEITSQQFDQLANLYLEKINEHFGGAQFITDKMPQNFLHLGLITKLFPNATIIHCRRNPLDTCLSCYFQEFSRGHPYSQKLETLGNYYLGYVKVMKHWFSILEKPVFNLDYEELISKPEETITALLNSIGLDWEENCLEFYKNRRVIQTQSQDQVRQALYSKSVGRWQNYEEHIQPLIGILGTESQW